MRRVCLLLAIGVLVACAAPAPRQPLSLMIWGDPAERAAYGELVAAFAALHPDLSIEIVYIPGQQDYRRRLAADLLAGTPADIVLINYRHYPAYAARGLLSPVAERFDQSEKLSRADFYPIALDAFTWEGRLTCLPQNVSSLVVYYNRALFDAAGLAYPHAGWSWDDLLAAAQALTRDNDGDGQNDQFGLGMDFSFIRMAPFIWQNGGELVDNYQKPGRLTLDEPAARAAIAWVVALQTEHHVVPDRVAEQAEDSELRFMHGRLAMLLNSRRGVPTYREISAFEWDVAPLPRGLQEASLLHSDAYCLPAAGTRQDEAWQFVEFANSTAGQTIIAATGRTVPSRRDVAGSPVFLSSEQPPRSSDVFLAAIPQLRNVPLSDAWKDIEEVLDAEFERAYYGEQSVDEALRIAAERARPLLAGAGTK